MRIDVRDENRRRLGRVEVDLTQRPARARTVDGEREVFLTWEAATDDAGRLRSCVACGGRDLYRLRTFPQLTGLVVVLAFAGAAVGVLARDFAENTAVLTALVVVLILDIASLIFRRYRLVCYRCGTTYTNLEIARQHHGWNRSTAERYSTAIRAPERERVGAPPPIERPAANGGTS